MVVRINPLLHTYSNRSSGLERENIRFIQSKIYLLGWGQLAWYYAIRVLTECSSSLNATRHCEHPIHTRIHLAESLRNDSQAFNPLHYIVVESKVSDRDAINPSILLKLPRDLLNSLSNSDQLRRSMEFFQYFSSANFSSRLGPIRGNPSAAVVTELNILIWLWLILAFLLLIWRVRKLWVGSCARKSSRAPKFSRFVGIT